MDYKKKYLKYKNKYINLQKGGASQVKINYDDNDVKLYQQTQANSICLNSKIVLKKLQMDLVLLKDFISKTR